MVWLGHMLCPVETNQTWLDTGCPSLVPRGHLNFCDTILFSEKLACCTALTVETIASFKPD